MSVYVVWAAIGAALLLIVALVWRLSKRRTDVVTPSEEPRPIAGEEAARPSGEARPPLHVVEAREEPAPVEAPTPLRAGLAKTRGGFVQRLASLLSRKKIEPGLLGEI